MGHPRAFAPGRPRINMGHPSLRGATLAMQLSGAAVGMAVNGQQVYQCTGGTPVVTPLGPAERANSSSVPIFQIGTDILGPTTSYTLLAIGTASNSGIYSAVDHDNGGTRRFQFRLNNGKVEFIPFDGGSAVITTVAAPVAMSAAECARGFLMMATVEPKRAAIVQNNTVVEATFTQTPGALTNNVYIGARSAGNQGWNTGGLSFFILWPRSMPAAELQSIAADPMAFIEWDEDYDAPAAITAAAADTPAASIAWTEGDDAAVMTAIATDRAAAAWTEADDIAAIAARETDRASISWTEANDSTTLSGTVLPNQSGGVAGAIAWTEASDTMTVSGALRDRGAVAWTEQDDVATLVAHADTPPNITLAVRFDVLPRRFGETITHYTN